MAYQLGQPVYVNFITHYTYIKFITDILVH